MKDGVQLASRLAPTVTVIVPCHNAEAFLPETLAAILAQSWRDLEVIVVDDGSTDGSASVVTAAADQRVRLLRQPASGGPSRPRNLAIGEARGRYVFFCDADDVMRAGKIEKQVRLLDERPEIGLVFTDFEVIDASGRVLEQSFLSGYQTLHRIVAAGSGPGNGIPPEMMVSGLLRANFIGTSSVALRKSVLDNVGRFDESLVSSEDLDLWLRIARRYACAFLDILGHGYRRHSASLMQEISARHPLARIEVLKRQLALSPSRPDRRVIGYWLSRNYCTLGYISEREGQAAAARRYYLEALRAHANLGAFRGWLKNQSLGRLRGSAQLSSACLDPPNHGGGKVTMTRDAPLVSLALPVYNGENYLRQALDSLTCQTWDGGRFEALEIIVSDNASTDGTEAICREFAAADPRVRYFRQERNIGAGPNYNFVFRQSRGRYFKWAAHDDYMDPAAMEICVRALEADPGAVLCHPLLVDVDADGIVIGDFDRADTGLRAAPERFFTIIQPGHNCAEVFGLTRREILAQTGLIRDYTDSDRTLLGELALRGRLRQVDGARFYRRIHAGKSDRVYHSYHERAEWFNPGNRHKVVLSAWNQLRDLSWSLLRSRLPAGQKLRCAYGLAKVTKWNAPLYRMELIWACRRCLRRL